MPNLVPYCDTDTSTLTFTNNGQVRCDSPGVQHAWQFEELENLGSAFTPMTIQDGLEISAAIILVWTVGYIGRLVIATVLKSRYG